MKLPPLPKWNTTTDDIDASDLRALAEEHERSLFPSGFTFPRTGQIWEAVRDCEVYFVALFEATSAPGPGWFPGHHPPESPTQPTYGRARLSQGERVRVVFTDDSRPLAVSFQPLRYDELHEGIVPADVRNAPRYSGYRLTLRTAPTLQWLYKESAYFTDAFRLIEDMA